MHGGRASNIGRRQSEDVVADIAAAEVQGDGALVVGFIERV